MFTIQVADSDAAKRACYALRADVYVHEKQWIPVQAAPENLEVDAHDRDAVHLLATDLAGNPAGTFRLLFPTPERALPIEAMFGVVPPAAEVACELSRLIVRREYRSSSHVVMLGLCRAIFEQCVIRGIKEMYAVLERPLLDGLRLLGFPFMQIGDEREIFGGVTMPTLCMVDDVISSLAKSMLRDKYRLSAFFAEPFDGLIDEPRLTWTSGETTV